jgi:hypothetical protein
MERKIIDSKPGISMRDIPWRCSNCKYQLGIVSKDKQTVRIKYKDLYVMVGNGSVLTICRRCGEQNMLENGV